MELKTNKKLEKISVKSQLLIGYLLPIIIFSLVFIFTVFVVLWNRISTNIYNSYYTNVTQINLSIDDSLAKIDNSLLNLYNDSYVFDYLRTVSRQIMYGDSADKGNESTFQIQERLTTLLNTNIEMYSVSLVDMGGHVQTVYKHGALPYSIEFSSEEYDELRKSHGELIVLSDNLRKNLDNSDERVIALGRKLIDSGNPNSLGTFVGYAIVEFEVSDLEDLLERQCANNGYSVLVYDGNQDIICSYTKDAGQVKQDGSVTNSQKASFWEDGYAVQENAISNWRIVGVIDKQTIREQALSIGMPLLLLAIGCALIIMLMSIRMGGMIGDMVEQIKHQSLSLVEIEREKKDMQIKLLYSQIKPHFLYNTLESIRMMSLVEEKELVANAIKALADIFRYNTSKDADSVAVLDEVLHMKNYFLLQKLRLRDKVELICDIDEDALNGKMPPFVLQPIVENSVKHAFGKMRKKGIINIKAIRNDNEIVFTVSDNGCGMTEEQIQAVYTMTGEENNGIGLKNINRRLKLLSGEGLEIESTPKQGTIVVFKVPQ